MNTAFLVINAGSSSIKFALFVDNRNLELLYQGEIESLFATPCMTILNAKQEQVLKQNITTTGHEAALNEFFAWLKDLPDHFTLKAIGHRVVHGGTFYTHPIVVSNYDLEKMRTLIPLAPLHQGHNLSAIHFIQTLYPDLPQVACFDTTFHHTQSRLATLFAIPRSLTDAGILRYGFHGISYEYIASIINTKIGSIGSQRVIVGHLGNGASMCAMYQNKSVATSMGFTALDGLMMGSRCGRIDPGVLLYLMQEKNYSAKQIEDLLYNQSGLLGVSENSNDVRTLLNSKDPKSIEAIELFCYRAALEAGTLMMALKGCDVLVFTAGIGEHAGVIRKKITEYFTWLGIRINDEANKNNALIISEKDSKIMVCVIPTDEAIMIARHTQKLLT